MIHQICNLSKLKLRNKKKPINKIMVNACNINLRKIETIIARKCTLQIFKVKLNKCLNREYTFI